jgi:tight adherence protein C
MLMAAIGASIGALLFWLLVLLLPPRVSALVRLARFDAHAQDWSRFDASAGGDHRQGPAARGGTARRLESGLGSMIGAEMRRRGFGYTGLRQDLTLTGGTFDAVLGRKLLGFTAGFLVVVVAVVGLQTGAGIVLPLGSPLLLALLLGVVCFFVPDVEARREASARRRDFRRALSAYLDLVALEMAGSAAPTEALPSAARVGSGWAMALIRDTLSRSTLAGRDPWEALTELGHRIGVPELSDLGNLVRLAGRDGARIRQTLTTRAAAMRRRDLADAEGEAGQRDQSMLIAQVLIGFGFMAFIGYPAVVTVLAL